MANKLNKDLTDKYVIVDKKYYKGTDIERLFHCEGGFGCSSDTTGRAIFGEFVSDKEECRIEGYSIKRLATKEEVELAKRE